MSTVKLTDEQIELTRRSMMKTAVLDMRHAANEMESAADTPWRGSTPAATAARADELSDARSGVAMVRESLSVLDALGWPCDETSDPEEVA